MGMLTALALTKHTHTIKNKHAQTILPFSTEWHMTVYHHQQPHHVRINLMLA